MLRSLLPVIMLACLLACSWTTSPANAEPEIGVNLSGPKDWSSELPLVDIFKLSRYWISQKPDAGWGKGPKLEMDEDDYVKSLPEGVYAEALMLTDLNGHYPQGRYTVLYDGKGRIEFDRAKVIERKPGRIIIEPDKAAGFTLRLHETDPGDYVRNIRVIMPGFEDRYQDNPWHPAFLDRWRGMACLRFMDYQHTNNSKVKTWDDRSKPTDKSWTGEGGFPVELLVDLANRLDADPWFCMPHEADDDYVRRFAQYVHENLDPELKAYVEYSNEVWNFQFEQARYAGRKGIELGLDEKNWSAGWKYTAQRSVEMFKIWEQEFGGTNRLVRVLASQSANPYVARQILGHQDAGRHADALAIAPYMGMNTKAGSVDAVLAMGVDGVLNKLDSEVLPEVIEKHFVGNKEAADAYELDLIAYEAGQHLVGIGPAVERDDLTRLFAAANRHPRMGDIYEQYYSAWKASGGGTMAVFSSVGQWSKWGSWGLMEHYDDDPTASPKFKATMEAAKRWGQPVEVPTGE